MLLIDVMIKIMIYIYIYISYDRIDVSEWIGVNKTSGSEECDICNYWYFLNKAFKIQPNVCNRSHDLLMMSMNFSSIFISNIKNADYWCIVNGISNSEAIKLLQNNDLAENWRML